METKVIPTAEEILDKYVSIDKEGNKRRIFNDEPIPAMIEFAKLHANKIRDLQKAKYAVGETGYIKNEEWEELLNEIK